MPTWLGPPYLSQYCIPTASLSGRSNLQSAARSDLFIPDHSTKSFGLRGFWVSGPRCWNSLCPHTFVYHLYLYLASAVLFLNHISFPTPFLFRSLAHDV